MPARRPQTPRPRDQLVPHETSSDEGKQRLLGELGRVAANVGQRVGKLERTTNGLADAPIAVTGSRAGGDALVSLLAALEDLGLITDETIP